jgi:hypothetical protein
LQKKQQPTFQIYRGYDGHLYFLSERVIREYAKLNKLPLWTCRRNFWGE